MLAGLVKGPNYFSPERAPDRARERLDYVLGRMQEDGVITAGSAQTRAGHVAAHHPGRAAAQRGRTPFLRLSHPRGEDGARPSAARQRDLHDPLDDLSRLCSPRPRRRCRRASPSTRSTTGRVDFQGPEANLSDADQADSRRRARSAPVAPGAPPRLPSPIGCQALERTRLPLRDVHWTPAVVMRQAGRRRRMPTGYASGSPTAACCRCASAAARSRAGCSLYDVVFVRVVNGQGQASRRAPTCACGRPCRAPRWCWRTRPAASSPWRADSPMG